ncbi:MAG: S8 family serine peptidase [Bacteroidales bacterium]|nr:S8 family serine peptidase [Bacteroidales bacterium]
MKKVIFLSLIVFLFGELVFSQKQNNKWLYNFEKVKTIEYKKKKKEADEFAVKNGLPIKQVLPDGTVMEIQEILNGVPQYYKTDNAGASQTSRANTLYSGGGLGLNVTGNGYSKVGEWDGGKVRNTHQEFGGRITLGDGAATLSDHSTHVAGTIIAAGGFDANAKGMAYQANLTTYEWTNDEAEMAAAAAAGMEISNHSYGYIRGWYYNGSSWIWYGDQGISNVEDYLFGFYNSSSQDIDNIAYNAPNYLICKSSGNDRGDGPGANPPTAEIDGGADGFDCIGTKGVAKNILTVGAVNEVQLYTGPNDVVMSSFSSWGPADDGRIKPDICAKGVDVYSTSSAADDAYISKNGTSMSTPSTTGTLVLLQQHYQNTHTGSILKAATLKALVLNTADEAGPDIGPDYMFGWGLLNAKRAAELISQDADGINVIDEQTLSDGATYSRDITVGCKPVKITIVWTDPAGTPTSAQLNPTTLMLVNDLDLRLTGPTGTHYPWKLDRNNPSDAATNSGENNVDNVETVYIENPTPGTYTIIIDHDGTLASSQDFSIIIQGLNEFTAIPAACSNLISPTDGATNLPISTSIIWSEVADAISYDVYFGTDAAATNILNGINQCGSTVLYECLSPSTTYYFKIYPRNNQGARTSCSTWSFTTGNASTSALFTENFDALTEPNVPSNWIQETSDDFNWESESGTTPSGNTGPDDDVTGGGKYIYTEASDPNYPNKTAVIYTPYLDLSAVTGAELDFYYHMYGANMGTLNVDIFDNGEWHSILSKSGEQHSSGSDAWTQVTTDLSKYRTCPYQQIRFKGTTDWWDSDMAIDEFGLTEVACTPPSSQATNFSATPDQNSIDISWTRGTPDGGHKVLVTAREGSAVNQDPTTGTTYTANAAFGSGTQIGTGNFVVYDGNGTSVTITNLNAGTTYHFAIYEYFSPSCYNLTQLAGNATTTAPSSPPSITSVSPDNFFADKGKQITIDGTDLAGATSVTIGGVSGTINTNTATEIIVTFPAGFYSDNTLTVTTGGGSDTETCTVNTRNIIPVGGGTDFHTSIQSALNGLFAWYGTTSFDAGQLAGTKTIDVYNGTYTDEVTPNVTLGTTAAENLIIQNHTGENPVIDASTNNFGIYIGDLDYVQITGFTVHSAVDDNIYTEGDNNTINLNRCYGASTGTGIVLNVSLNSDLSNNLLYNNYNYGLRLIGSNNTVVKNNTIADNGHESKGPPLPGPYIPAQLYVESGTGVNISNNIFYAKTGTNIFTLMTESGITVTSDFNTYYKNGNTSLVFYNGALYADIAAWTGNGAGTNDKEGDPLFVTNGTDFHIFSVYDSYHTGEWPPTTAVAGTWTADASTSPALDAGNPFDAFTNEPVSGGRINQGAYGNTVQASKSGGIRWDGSTDSDWQTTTNWTPEQIPASTDDVTVPDGCPNYPVIDDGTTTAECNNIIIEANSNIEIADNGQMTVSGNVTNNAGASGIAVKSNTSGDGSLIINNSAIDATVERYLSHTNGEEGQWHFLGSPVTAAPVSLFNTNNFYEYDETQDDWWTGATYFFNGTSGWNIPAGNLTVGQGYIYYYYEHTLNYQGTLNHNDAGYDITAEYTLHSGNAGNGDPYTNFDGWNLLSNPHPSVIDWESMNRIDITSTVYYYDDGSNNYAYYPVGGPGVNGGTQYIPSGQGFFVKSNDGVDGGILTIPNSAKVHHDESFRKTVKIYDNLLKLRMDYSGYSDETLVMFKDNATIAFDDQFDAYKRFSWNDDVIQIYTFNPGINTDFAINTVFGNDEIVIPLAFKVNTGDVFTIYSNEFNFDEYSVFLYDTEEDIYTELSLGKTYSFNSEPGTFTDRFELIFEKSAVSVPQAFNTSVVLYPNPNTGLFYLTVGNKASDFNVEITNVTGQIIYKNTFENNLTTEINMNSHSSGVYFVKIKFSDNSEINKKIILK